jgi:hypothetical protein
MAGGHLQYAHGTLRVATGCQTSRGAGKCLCEHETLSYQYEQPETKESVILHISRHGTYTLGFSGPSGYSAGNDWANEREDGCRCFIFAPGRGRENPNPLNPDIHVHGRMSKTQ